LASRSAASRTPSSSFTKDGAGVAGVDATRFCPGNCSSPETNVRQTISICRMLPGASADQPPGTDNVSHLRNHGENTDTQSALASAIRRGPSAPAPRSGHRPTQDESQHAILTTPAPVHRSRHHRLVFDSLSLPLPSVRRLPFPRSHPDLSLTPLPT
jgi:hypothetical protein